MNAIELAAELARLNTRQRKRLLAGVPAAQRALLTRLIEDMQPVAAQAPSAFAQLIDELAATTPKPVAWRSDARVLDELLAHESSALKRLLHNVFQGRGDSLLTVHVTELVADYLDTRLLQLPPATAARAPRRFGHLPWLQRFGKQA